MTQDTANIKDVEYLVNEILEGVAPEKREVARQLLAVVAKEVIAGLGDRMAERIKEGGDAGHSKH